MIPLLFCKSRSSAEWNENKGRIRSRDLSCGIASPRWLHRGTAIPSRRSCPSAFSGPVPHRPPDRFLLSFRPFFQSNAGNNRSKTTMTAGCTLRTTISLALRRLASLSGSTQSQSLGGLRAHALLIVLPRFGSLDETA